MPKKLKFPDGFLWGAATAAHQVEGNTRNNWSRWEPTVAEELAEGAEERLKNEVPRWDLIKNEATNPENYISGEAADHYNRYEEDFDILAGLNLNAYRFSIEWSRIEPKPGEFNQEALDHYRQVLKALRERDIEPMVCLHHFTNPTWVDELGGWHNPEVADHFIDYADKVLNELGEYCNKWLTFNEANSYCLSKYLGGGIWPGWPEAEDNPWHMWQAVNTMARAHKEIYRNFKSVDKNNQVSHDHGVAIFEPGRKDPISILATKFIDYMSHMFPRKVEGFEDFLGIHYYIKVHIVAGFSDPQEWQRHRGETKTDIGWSIYPRGIYEVTQKLKGKDLPIYITENGVHDARDALRADFIKDHLYWLHKSIQDGADIRGYFHWSLLDNFEWSEGYWPKLGLVRVNRETMERKIKSSAREYAEIAKSDMIEKR